MAGEVASVSSQYLNQVGLAALTSKESSLRTAIEAVSNKPSPSTVDMLDLQQQVQQWSLMIQVVTTLNKELSDALKGVVQKTS